MKAELQKADLHNSRKGVVEAEGATEVKSHLRTDRTQSLMQVLSADSVNTGERTAPIGVRTKVDSTVNMEQRWSQTD